VDPVICGLVISRFRLWRVRPCARRNIPTLVFLQNSKHRIFRIFRLYQKYRVRIKLLFLQNTRSDSNFNQICNYNYRTQALKREGQLYSLFPNSIFLELGLPTPPHFKILKSLQNHCLEILLKWSLMSDNVSILLIFYIITFFSISMHNICTLFYLSKLTFLKGF